MNNTTTAVCPRCGVAAGELHTLGCAMEQCLHCGGQLLRCFIMGPYEAIEALPWPPPDEDRIPWSGEWPGVAECHEFQWYARRNPDGAGWLPCNADEPVARPDLNRLHSDATWSREAKRFTRE
jgi:hypothetical protein